MALSVALSVAIIATLIATFSTVAHAQPAQGGSEAISQPPVAESAAESEAKPRFDILEFQIEGNSVLPTLSIEKAVYPYLGPGKSIDDVEKARTALEQAYQQSGYLTVLVDIPEQKVASGVVQLRVTEGRVDKLKVSGNRYYSRGYIRSKVPALTAGRVPHFPQVQEELVAAGKGEARKVTPVLRPGQTPGKVEVELKIEDRSPWHGGIELNNRQSADTEPLRLAANLRYDNLWQRDHSVSLQYQVAPQDPSQVRAISGTYVLPLPGSNVLALYAVDSHSDIATLGDTNVIGDGSIFGARGIFPLRNRERYFHSLTLGADYKDFDESTGILGADSFETPITYLPMLIEYRSTRLGDKGTTEISFGLNFALRDFLGSNSEEEFTAKRFNASANYLYLRAGLERTHTLPQRWTLVGRLDGQLASGPLISNEQFTAGGADSVRGYLESEELGDDGLRLSFEVRTPPTGLGPDDAIDSLYGLLFVEGAQVWVRDALPSQNAGAGLASIGVGLRLTAWKNLSAALDVALPLEDAQKTDAGQARMHFRLAYEF